MNKIIKRVIITIIFLGIAVLVFNIAPEYDLEYKYKDGDIRVIFNDQEITRELNKLPQTAILVDGEVLLSQDTVDILFDKNLYYEKKYDTLITTTTEHRANIKIDSKTIEIDEKTETLKVPAMKVNYKYAEDDRYEGKTNKEEIIYIPIKALEKVYDMTVEFNDKVIITENNKNRVRVNIDSEDAIELKHTEDSFAKNVEIVEGGNYIDIFNYDETKDFSLARSYTGELGYVSKDELKNYNMALTTKVKEPEKIEKINIAWDYIHPDATNIGNKSSREKNDGLDVVAPTILYLKNSNGDLKYNNNVVTSYLEWAKKVGYRVWVTLKNDNFSIDKTSEFLNDMNNRQNAINSIIEFANKYNVEGINIDIEHIYQADGTAFSQFIRELYVKAKKNNLIISVCVNVPDGSPDWSLCYQHNALSEYSDYLALMAYDQYGASSKVAGPTASYSWVKESIDKLVNRDKVNSEKILLGLAFYSRLWRSRNGSVSGTTLTMSGVKEYLNKTPKPIWSEEAGQYYYESEGATSVLWLEENESIAKKLGLIEEYDLGGTAAWMLGYETPDIWTTIKENTNY